MTTSLPSNIEKSSIGREHPFLTKAVSIMNSCSIQYNPPLEKYSNVAQETYSFRKKLFVCVIFSSTSDTFRYLFFGRGLRQNSTCLYQIGSLHILCSYCCILSILDKKLPFWNQSFQNIAIVAFSTN